MKAFQKPMLGTCFELDFSKDFHFLFHGHSFYLALTFTLVTDKYLIDYLIISAFKTISILLTLHLSLFKQELCLCFFKINIQAFFSHDSYDMSHPPTFQLRWLLTIQIPHSSGFNNSSLWAHSMEALVWSQCRESYKRCIIQHIIVSVVGHSRV